MLTRLVFLLSLTLVSVVFLTGAWPGTFPLPARSADSTFTPQVVQLDADIIGERVDAALLLQKAVAAHAPAKMPWLKTRIRQTMCEGSSNFVAEGFLQRGPRGCARLEMQIRNSRVTVVSDGAIVAHVRELADTDSKVTINELGADVEEALPRHGCGGPFTALRQLQRCLKNGRLQTGLLGETPVIRVLGDFDPEQGILVAAANVEIRSGCVYLDAKTLWPHRVEWWGDYSKTLRPLVQIEFLENEIGRELSEEECVQTFSYRPVDAR